jgi:hypothetical protein
MPDLAAGCVVQAIDPGRGATMKHSEHFRETGAFFRALRRSGNEVIMIREHRPSFELPCETLRDLEKPSVQNIEPVACPKVMRLEIRSRRHEINSGFG